MVDWPDWLVLQKKKPGENWTDQSLTSVLTELSKLKMAKKEYMGWHSDA